MHIYLSSWHMTFVSDFLPNRLPETFQVWFPVVVRSLYRWPCSMASPYSQLKEASCTQQETKTLFISTHGYQYYGIKMHLDVCCCNSHGDLAKILEKTCPRSPCKETLGTGNTFRHLLECTCTKSWLYIAMKVIIIF